MFREPKVNFVKEDLLPPRRPMLQVVQTDKEGCGEQAKDCKLEHPFESDKAHKWAKKKNSPAVTKLTPSRRQLSES